MGLEISVKSERDHTNRMGMGSEEEELAIRRGGKRDLAASEGGFGPSE